MCILQSKVLSEEKIMGVAKSQKACRLYSLFLSLCEILQLSVQSMHLPHGGSKSHFES